jgi:hypothetical protein
LTHGGGRCAMSAARFFAPLGGLPSTTVVGAGEVVGSPSTTVVGAGEVVGSVASPVLSLRIERPSSSNRKALWTMRFRMASARVGSLNPRPRNKIASASPKDAGVHHATPCDPSARLSRRATSWVPDNGKPVASAGGGFGGRGDRHGDTAAAVTIEVIRRNWPAKCGGVRHNRVARPLRAANPLRLQGRSHNALYRTSPHR